MRAPPDKSFFFNLVRLSRKTSKPSNSPSCVGVIWLLVRVMSMTGHSAKSAVGRHVKSSPLIRLLVRSSDFSLDNDPTSAGTTNIELRAKLSSMRWQQATNISGGNSTIALFERSRVWCLCNLC